MYAIFEVKAPDVARIDAVLQDDLVSRQSIAIREGSALGIAGLGRAVLIEGTEAAVARAAELFQGFGTRLEGVRAEAVLRVFRSQDEDAASGIGLIFG
jgi:hypothetical protein